MSKKILVVDDEPDILKVTSFRVKRFGFDVVTAIDGQGALDAAKNEKPDLILLDVRLPIMNGTDVCARLKEDSQMKTIPIIFLTASSDTLTQQRAKDLGADGLLTKPFDPEQLRETIIRLLK